MRHRPTPTDTQGQDWLAQVFRSKSAHYGGTVRRKLADIEREIGFDQLELEVRRRGFHMAICGPDVVISCQPKAIMVIC